MSSLNRWLDGLAAPRDAFAGVTAPAYLVLGAAGVGAGASLFLGLTLVAGASTAVATVLIIAAVAMFLVTSLLRRAIAGREVHVLFQDVVLALGVAGVATYGLGEPVLPWLDRAAPALGTFLVFGRMGCLAGGCCHGRPAATGVCYQEAGAVPRPLVGVRLFPIQLVEAAWTLVVTIASVAAVGAAPGTALSIWLLAYAAGRFVLEFARGDLGRNRLGPLTEAQWWAVVLLAGRIAWEEVSSGEVRVVRLTVLAGAALLAAVVWALRGRILDLPRAVLVPEDVAAWEKFAAALESHASSPGNEALHAGPIDGVRVGLRVDPTDEGRIHSFTVSGTRSPLDKLAVAGFLVQRLPMHQIVRAGVCEKGSVHLWLLVRDGAPPGSTLDDDPRLVSYRAHDFARRLAGVRVDVAPPSEAPTSDQLPPNRTQPRPDWQPRLRV